MVNDIFKQTQSMPCEHTPYSYGSITNLYIILLRVHGLIEFVPHWNCTISLRQLEPWLMRHCIQCHKVNRSTLVAFLFQYLMKAKEKSAGYLSGTSCIEYGCDLSQCHLPIIANSSEKLLSVPDHWHVVSHCTIHSGWYCLPSLTLCIKISRMSYPFGMHCYALFKFLII